MRGSPVRIRKVAPVGAASDRSQDQAHRSEVNRARIEWGPGAVAQARWTPAQQTGAVEQRAGDLGQRGSGAAEGAIGLASREADRVARRAPGAPGTGCLTTRGARQGASRRSLSVVAP